MPSPLENKFVENAEAELGARLPTSYREAMMLENGGEIDAGGDHWWLHPIYDTSDRKKIKRTCNHVLSETKNRREWSEWPESALDIAGNGGGDALVILKDGDAFKSEIHIWFHDGHQMQQVARDFSELARGSR